MKLSRAVLFAFSFAMACTHPSAPQGDACECAKRAAWAELGYTGPVPDSLTQTIRWDTGDRVFYFLELGASSTKPATCKVVDLRR